MNRKSVSRLNRREVLRAAGIATAAGLTGRGAALADADTPPSSTNGSNPYTKIGVRPFINLTATYTINGGTLTLPEVKKAMEEASHFSVNLDELMDKVGARIAELLGSEGAIVSSGAAAALTHATAACVAGADPELMKQLPDLTGLKNEVIMPKQSRNEYDHAIRTTGVQIIEVDSPQEFHNALGRRTAMIAVLGSGEARGKVRLEEIVEAGRKHGIPVLVDAAAELPLKPNPYLSRGADLVAYSGGKIIRGPQCAGLLLGRKDLIKAAWVNSAPHHAFGRMMKVGKEEVMGMLAAIETWTNKRDIQQEYRLWESWLRDISDTITKIPGIRTEMRGPAGASPFPVMNVDWEPDKIGMTSGELYELLLNGEPRIMSHAGGPGHSFLIRPVTIKPGDHLLVAQRLREIFSKAPKGKQSPAVEAPQTDVAGRWEVDIQFASGSAKHILALETKNNKLSGLHLGRKLRGELTGTVVGNRIQTRSVLPFEGTGLSYEFTGEVSGDRMSGELSLGEYGKARWSARRV
jgi:L-seryl-tRNA(Ser) seleniumtransferase